jgi:hypothetical protein
MMGDLSPRDLANVPRTCNDVSECRRFSSYCDPPGCVCLSLSKNEPDPVCESSNMITCFVDPCQVDNRMLRCDNRVCLLL